MRGDRDEVEGLRPAAATAPVAPAISAVADVIASAGCERSIYLGPLALLLGLTGLAGFLWTLKSGQYDDLDGAALRILPSDDVTATQ
jgi:cbb3-type cytochrome oxidase maturation protein